MRITATPLIIAILMIAANADAAGNRCVAIDIPAFNLDSDEDCAIGGSRRLSDLGLPTAEKRISARFSDRFR